MSVHIILRELNIPYELEEVDLKTKTTISGKNYLEVNPKGAVPALLTDNKEILTENVAIMQYLADTNNTTTLLPSIGHFIRYHVLEWLSFLSSDVHKSFSPIFNPTVEQEDKDTIFFPALEKKLEIINDRLADHEYLMGINFTLPDAYLFVMLRWYVGFKRDLSKYAHLYRYFNDLKNRPSIQAAMKEEDIKVN
jgi:glutathione S-transferase